MRKVSMELCRVTKHLKLKFGLVINGNDPNAIPIISSFEREGNEYITVIPYPFITIDISNKKEKEWNPNQSFNISGMTKFLFTKRLREIKKEFEEEEKLFYEQEGKLYVNQQLAQQHRKLVPVGKGKTCLFIPVVVDDEDSGDQFEGISMMINTPDNYSNITFEEFEFLIDFIERTDLSQLTLQFLNIVYMQGIQKNLNVSRDELRKGIMLVAQRLYKIEQEAVEAKQNEEKPHD